MSTKDHNFVPDLCKKLVKDLGLRSYRFDLRFDKDEFEPDHRYKFSGYNDDIDDLECVIRFLRAEGFAPFCLFGHSRGANDVLLYASTRTLQSRAAEKLLGDDHHHRIQSVASIVELANELQEDDDEKKSSFCTSDSSDAHLLDAEKLLVIAAAPRFDMPRMLTTLFTPDKIDSLEGNDSFPWESQRCVLKCLFYVA
jgi:hypothetical protein